MYMIVFFTFSINEIITYQKKKKKKNLLEKDGLKILNCDKQVSLM